MHMILLRKFTKFPAASWDTAQPSLHHLQSKGVLPLFSSHPNFPSYLLYTEQGCLARAFLPSACPPLVPAQLHLSANVSQWATFDFYFSVQHKYLYSLHRHPKHN